MLIIGDIAQQPSQCLSAALDPLYHIIGLPQLLPQIITQFGVVCAVKHYAIMLVHRNTGQRPLVQLYGNAVILAVNKCVGDDEAAAFAGTKALRGDRVQL